MKKLYKDNFSDMPSFRTRRSNKLLPHFTQPPKNMGKTALADRSNQSADPRNHKESKGLYIISVASQMLKMHPQTLRKYERLGLIKPSRTIGMLRLYSQDDIMTIQAIKLLIDDLKLNLAGVRITMALLHGFPKRKPSAAKQVLHNIPGRTTNKDLSRLLELMNITKARTGE
ncbi:MAG: hypothetical protein CL896_03165 [Dehalococcoidia bacterium]|nr:hypothetical protein [Dehalococcoidia bacterium]